MMISINGNHLSSAQEKEKRKNSKIGHNINFVFCKQHNNFSITSNVSIQLRRKYKTD